MKSALVMLMMASPVVALADSPDASFYKNAAEAGISEVDAGNLASDKGNSQAVKDFGAKMVKDHGAANDKLKSIADSKSISLPTTASIGQMATKAKLDVLTGDTFDKSYIKSQIKGHRATEALLRKEIASGQDPEAKAFAVATLPTVKMHMKEIVKIANDAGVSTK